MLSPRALGALSPWGADPSVSIFVFGCHQNTFINNCFRFALIQELEGISQGLYIYHTAGPGGFLGVHLQSKSICQDGKHCVSQKAFIVLCLLYYVIKLVDNSFVIARFLALSVDCKFPVSEWLRVYLRLAVTTCPPPPPPPWQGFECFFPRLTRVWVFFPALCTGCIFPALETGFLCNRACHCLLVFPPLVRGSLFLEQLSLQTTNRAWQSV